MEIEFILCVIKDLSSERDSQISLFVIFNIIIIIIIIIFLEGRMSRISKFALKE